MNELHESLAYSILNNINYGLSIFSFACSFVIMVVIFCFLHNSLPERQCFLLYLHKDFVAILISLRSMWLLKIIFEDDKNGMWVYAAKFLSLSLISMTLAVLVLINLISAFKFYIFKTKLSDPPMPWGADENFGLTCTRIIVGLNVLGYPSVLFLLGFYPRIYHLDAKQNIDVENANLISWLYLGPYTVLITMFLMLSLGAKISKDTTKDQINGIIPKEIAMFSWVSVLALVGVICIALSEDNGISSVVGWKIIQLMTSIVQIVFPSSVVLYVEQLKSYAVKFFKRRLDEAFFYNIYLIPTSLCCFMYLTLRIVYSNIGIS